MNTIPYMWVPIIAVFCYSFQLIALLSAEKNKTIQSFIYILICFILWTGGSMFMRLQVFPGYKLWYEISILALFAAPFLVYNFLFYFVEAKNYFYRSILFVSTIIMLILTHFQLFLKIPELIQLESGRNIFVYNMTWHIALPTILIIFILLSGVKMVFQGIKKQDTSITSLMPIFFGLPVLVIGNLASIIPGNFFPWDTLAGITNALLMLYALYRKRLFRMRLLVSRGVILAATMTLGILLCANLISPLEQIIKQLPLLSKYITLIIAILFSSVTMIGYIVLQKILNNLFLKDEQVQNQKLKNFSFAVSNSLDLKEILGLLLDVICSTININKAYVCLVDQTGQRYKISQSSTPLDTNNFSISSENPCITWFNNRMKCMIMEEFKRTPTYKSMWDSEKKMFVDLNISCVLPLKRDGDLVGIVLLGKKNKHPEYSYDDISFLESAQSIATVAVKNANLYEQARKDATTDNLTELLNRKSFMSILNDDFKKCKDSSLALVILNLDDFKLYNQLYGTYAGDLALQNVARIIKNTVGTNGTAGRYGGKEFAISLPHYNIMQTLQLAENIQQQIGRIDSKDNGVLLKPLSLSGGICVMPYGASTVKELIENTDMAVYNAKRSGKNKICQYLIDEKVNYKENNLQDEREKSSYSEYAATIYALTAAIDAKDHYTFSHSQNVALYATTLAKAAGLNEEHVQIINEAALLHDIGKIAIPEHILSKPGRLTIEEYEIMKTHVEHSIAIIRHLPSLDYVIPAAIAHHERWDGNGYPRGISGEDIPIGARCLAIADSFDAMTSIRTYKSACTIDYAANEIKSQAGMQFDPKLAFLFVELMNNGSIKIQETKQQI